MFLLAALIFVLPIYRDEMVALSRPFCGGVSVAGPVVVDRINGAAAPVVGCASRVHVECDPEVVARPVRPWLTSGDVLTLALSPAAVGGEASCTLHSDQGDATVTVWIPA